MFVKDIYLKATISAIIATSSMPAAASAVNTSGDSGQFYINYTVNLLNYSVSDIVLLEQGAPNPNTNGYGTTCCFSADSGSVTTLTDPFLKTDPIAATFALGVTSDLPGDAPGQQHLVIFTNDQFAIDAQNIAFGTLFPNSNETTLINDLTTNPNGSNAFNDFETFASGDAATGPNGPLAFGQNDAFNVIAFSNAQTIGAGNSFTTPAVSGAVPEPATWAMMLVGFGMVGFAMRNSRKQTVRVTYG